ncbi:hypothetical protein LTR91_022254 [Friedmanniomyces endolithicus]|uniref:Uncharacterized protein n=1 Tax=Friedmanniomyces endolithicus TaxID=329885 RepID=A0AAN6K2N1_9PEZI|nr:hypothetical protein LTR94_010842 [Friedmanniomyces endolithicus]KAK0812098.1 hypothetical protein LTR59_001574 [Friedmanniomyces endolithicus]KAK0819322.1 hypothetical protein LTR38_000765 [Friedmanniomyces endolithicus]KAK0821843.1 hypothetical protein LTR75_000500 [Friedmanniomyces endolithicus]KAK0847369.1 hypothetical protein LTR03_006346 [Friedmanniomyces endolithicus]
MIAPAIIAFALAATQAAAQRPTTESICDYYTTAVLKDNNATNQETIVTLVVNTAVIGNFTPNKFNISVPGILAANQTYNGTAVNLAQYFDGTLASSNRGGSAGVSVNFLDDGGAEPLTKGKPANGASSNQYMLMTHLYEYFGILLGCTQYGNPGYPAYGGDLSMYSVHKYMALDPYDFGFFVQQVALSAASFGVAQADLEVVGGALGELFGHKCSPASHLLPSEADTLQAICITDDCPLAVNATCSLYDKVLEPMFANGSATNASASGTGSGSSTSSMSSMKNGAGGAKTLCGSLLVLTGVVGTMYWLI